LGIIIGNEATNASGSNFLGNRSVMDVFLLNFFGTSVGYLATGVLQSNSHWVYAGYEAKKCFSSNFIGSQAGNQANKC
jgi:hypothetical protein